MSVRCLARIALLGVVLLSASAGADDASNSKPDDGGRQLLQSFMNDVASFTATFEQTLLDAWDVDEARREEKAKARKAQRALDNWARLLKGLRIRAKVQAKYRRDSDPDQPAIGSQPLVHHDLQSEASSSLQPQEERAKAWPQASENFTL